MTILLISAFLLFFDIFLGHPFHFEDFTIPILSSLVEQFGFTDIIEFIKLQFPIPLTLEDAKRFVASPYCEEYVDRISASLEIFLENFSSLSEDDFYSCQDTFLFQLFSSSTVQHMDKSFSLLLSLVQKDFSRKNLLNTINFDRISFLNIAEFFKIFNFRDLNLDVLDVLLHRLLRELDKLGQANTLNRQDIMENESLKLDLNRLEKERDKLSKFIQTFGGSQTGQYQSVSYLEEEIAAKNQEIANLELELYKVRSLFPLLDESADLTEHVRNLISNSQASQSSLQSSIQVGPEPDTLQSLLIQQETLTEQCHFYQKENEQQKIELEKLKDEQRRIYALLKKEFYNVDDPVSQIESLILNKNGRNFSPSIDFSSPAAQMMNSSVPGHRNHSYIEKASLSSIPKDEQSDSATFGAFSDLDLVKVDESARVNPPAIHSSTQPQTTLDDTNLSFSDKSFSPRGNEATKGTSIKSESSLQLSKRQNLPSSGPQKSLRRPDQGRPIITRSYPRIDPNEVTQQVENSFLNKYSHLIISDEDDSISGTTLSLSDDQKLKIREAQYLFVTDGKISQTLIREIGEETSAFVLVIPAKVDAFYDKCFSHFSNLQVF